MFDLGGAGAGEWKVAVTYESGGQLKQMKVSGGRDMRATAGLQAAMEGKDLQQFVSAAKGASGSSKGESGTRMVFEAELALDEGHPENRAAAQAFINGRDASGRPVSRLDSAGALYDRFKSDATMNGRLYKLDKETTGADVDLGVFAVGGEYTSEDASLVDAYYRDKLDGGFKRWDECVRSVA